MKNKKHLLLVLSTAVISGVSIFLNQYGVTGIDSGVFTFSKNFVVAIFLFSLIFGLNNLKEFSQLKKEDWFKIVLIGLVGGSVPFLLFFRGLQLTTGASAALIHKSLFIFVTMFAIIFLKEKLDKKVIAASMLLITGNYLLLRPSWSFNYGDLMILVATILWAAENIISKHTLIELSGNMVAFGRMFFGSLFILIYLAATEKFVIIQTITTPQLTWIFITSGMLFLYVFTWYNGLKKVPVSLASAILLLGSPITTLLKFTTGTPLTLTNATSMVLIIAGIVVFMNSTSQFNLKKVSELWLSKTKH